MSFYNVIKEYEGFDFPAFFASVQDSDIERILEKEKLTHLDFLALLSEKAAGHLEPMAAKAQRLTVQYFGRTIQLFIPLYISNYCSNECTYCGFNLKNKIKRRKLTIEEIEVEAREIAKTGIQHLLILTGEPKRLLRRLIWWKRYVALNVILLRFPSKYFPWMNPIIGS